MVYAAKRKSSQAIEMFQKFLELAPPADPDRKRAKEAINELKRR
jgi:cytochrome c-type biogenesis protein CcmH/NrfG